MFSINTNSGALVALQNLNTTNQSLNKVQNRINTGLKVAGAKDDASIFAIAQNQRAELGGLSAVKDSLNRAKGAIDVALAASEAISDLMISMREKVIATLDPGNDTTSFDFQVRDYKQMAAQVVNIVQNAEFNGRNVLQTDDIVAITDSNASSANALTVTASNFLPNANGLSILTFNDIADAGVILNNLDANIDIINGELSKFGAAAKRIDTVNEFTDKLSDAIEVGIGNMVDADLARESADLQSLQVKQQLGLQALSIANQAPGTVLSLFR